IGPSDAYLASLAGPVAIPSGSFSTLVSVSIPQPGKYVIWAKGTVVQTAGGSATVACQLVTGVDFDRVVTLAAPAPLAFAVPLNGGRRSTPGGPAGFQCSFSAGAAGTASSIRIAAVKVANLTNTG